MVSFQCNHCADILTKPKLDKHWTGCHASFDCIDCHRHFETPADYKGHTSCITEAEKHQKTLYNGGKQGGPERNGGTQRSRHQGGGRQWGDNRQRWQQQNVNRATGANVTPLGTPARMSPVNDTPVVEEDSRKMQPTAETAKKRKVETETTESKGAFKSAEKRRKKQKTVEDTQETTQAEVVEVGSKTERRPIPEVTIPKRPPHDANIQPAENGNALQEVDEKKRKKKKKKETEAKEDEKGVKKEKKRKKKEDASPSGEELGSVVMVDTKATVEAPLPASEVPSETNPEKAQSSKKSKSKSKSKVKVPTADETPGVATVAEVAEIARSDPGENLKKRGHSDDHEDEGDVKRVAQETSKEKRKEKKKKRKSEG